MRKAPDAFRTISEVAELLQTPAHVLRFWESKFSHVKPVKRAGGRRYYRPADVLLLAGIRSLLHDQGMTIRGVQKMLSDKGTRHVAGLAPPAMVADIDGEEAEIEVIEAAPAIAEGSAEDTGEADTAPLATGATPDPSETAPDNTDADPVTEPSEGAAPMEDAPLPDTPVEEAPRLALRLRDAGAEQVSAHRPAIAAAARRLDALLDRMSQTSGVRRW